MIPAFLCYAIVALYGITGLIGENAGAVVLGLFLYGWSVIPFAYMCSFMFNNYTTAQNTMLFIFFITGVILLVAGILLDFFESTRDVNTSLKYIYKLFPSYCFGEAIAALIVRTSVTATFGSPRGIWDMKTVGWSYVFMAWEGVVYFLIVLIIEKIQATPQILSYFQSTINPELTKFDDEDSDVVDEKTRLQASHLKSNESISIRGLRKVYAARMGQKPKIAVHDLWLSIPKGTCYGKAFHSTEILLLCWCS